MHTFRIAGGRPLTGTVAAAGAKNAALPIMAAALLADGPVTLFGVPRVADVATLCRVLVSLGVDVQHTRGDRLQLEVGDRSPFAAPDMLVRRLRASFNVLGPLVARRGKARVSLPGGCKIGDRPVDLHLHGLARLGAEIRIHRGAVEAKCQRLRGAHIDLSGPFGSTVSGTANVLSAATLARGTTVITGAACEPEIVDLGRFLIAMGASIEGLGTSTLEIHGVERLDGATHTIIPDRIEAGTLLLAAAMAGGRVTVTNAIPEHLSSVLDALEAVGANVFRYRDRITLERRTRLWPLDIDCAPYPAIPTDLQPQWTALLTLARGHSRIRDLVFPARLGHLSELRRFGASIGRDATTTHIRGVLRLGGADVNATDLRTAAALVLAGLAADGDTTLRNLRHLDRGYERPEEKLRQLGAAIERVGEAAVHAPHMLTRESSRMR